MSTLDHPRQNLSGRSNHAVDFSGRTPFKHRALFADPTLPSDLYTMARRLANSRSRTSTAKAPRGQISNPAVTTTGATSGMPANVIDPSSLMRLHWNT